MLWAQPIRIIARVSGSPDAPRDMLWAQPISIIVRVLGRLSA